MTEATTGQISRSAAQVYEEFFVPALFAEPAARIVEATRLEPGQHVLDVACGTGVLARAALAKVAPGGLVAGLDRNQGMLEVAKAHAAGIAWRCAQAEHMPYDDRQFDVVLCQFGLMFFDDRRAALQEMWRVLKPGGVLGIAVWDLLERSPGYAAMTALLDELFGAEVANALRVPFALGSQSTFRALLAEAQIGDAEIGTLAIRARFPSLDSWVHTDIRGWTLSGMIDDQQFHTLLDASHKALQRFVLEDGTVAFDAPALLAIAHKR
jgi:SAM-dependent methyltransferase